MDSNSPSPVETSREEMLLGILSLNEPLFDLALEHGHERISSSSDPECGYRGIIAIQNTVFGPALGETRFWNHLPGNDLGPPGPT